MGDVGAETVFGLARSRRGTLCAIGAAGIIAIAASILVAPDLRGATGALLALTMLAIAAIDARRFIIPDQLSAAGFALALVNAGIQNPDSVGQAIAASVLRAATLALLFLGLRIGYRRLRKREGIGLGDVKLAAVAGAWLDWTTMPIAIEIAAISALAVYVLRRRALGLALHPLNRLPFGVFFAPAIWLGWLLETAVLMPY
jgi:leader peptidase (prepilin peptidase) / N-methyltransferase